MLIEPQFLAQLDRLVLVSRRMRAGQIQGERRSPKRGGSVEFADFRSYTSGDDFRQIDWNAYARLEKLFIKLFVAEEDLTIHILLDTSQSMNWGNPIKWPYAQQLAAALGYIGLASMDRVTGGALTSKQAYRCPPQRGKRQSLTWFNWLSTLKPEGHVDPISALGDYLTHARHPGPLLIISDLLGTDWDAGLRTLASHSYEINVLHVLAPQEVRPDLEGDLRLVDSESGAGVSQKTVEITADYDLLQRYTARLAAWQDHLKQMCRKIGAHYVFIETSQPLEPVVLMYLRRHAIIT